MGREPAKYLEHGDRIKPIKGQMLISLGFGSTGTHSLSKILKSIGYTPMHYKPETVLQAIHDRNFGLMMGYNAWLDDPVPSIWKILLEVFIEAKFIMVYRQDYNRRIATG